MCTAASFNSKSHYFGRNLDLEFSYNETVVITPRNYTLPFRKEENIDTHYAIIGMAFVVENYPLYYDATNEKGLSMAGLNFPEAKYYEINKENDNITPFEFIPWILGQAENIKEAKKLIENINLVNINFSEQLPLSPLHWMISDKNESIVIECMEDGMKIYDNPLGVMTNSPSFDKQLFNLNNYRHLSRKTPDNTFSEKIELDTYSRGMGAIGLPGDLSSMSRFVKVAFTHENVLENDDEIKSVNQFFHILESVYQQKGCCEVAPGKYEYTIYSSCVNTDKGIYYYKTYDNSSINAVKMHNYDLESNELAVYPLIEEQEINFQN
ncbi:choloylglycine hydrolase [Methanosphaera sp. ISO3-F5]|uniref:choloylglycine hydrolase n=1 Tax=Methanosphaera sp. ISO3-F5 TaxID=1452353 RepID=UPI002B2596F9|nr:choloylglycine hydrolase [Methanosphaera sp. ISO3-F5]WQH63418.1 choloylglycine hydrolase [Methanosphaera sp. ISO3-F5]